MKPNNLELKLVKNDESQISLDDSLQLATDLDHDVKMDADNKLHPNYIHITLSNYDGNKEELMDKISKLGYKSYEGDKK
jgi:hypothetical protein